MSTKPDSPPARERPSHLRAVAWRHATLGSHPAAALPSEHRLVDHLESTRVRESGKLVSVNPALFFKTGGLAISNLSDSVRVNTRYSLLKLHN